MNFNIKTKIVYKIIVLVILISLKTFIYINQVNSVSEQTSKSKGTDQIKTVVKESSSPLPSEQENSASPEEDINDVDDSNITTKIYKSSEPSSDLLEDLSNLDSSTDQDILNKDELIGKKKNPKAIKRLKSSRFETNKLRSKNLTLFPWIMLVILILVLGFIFKLLKQKKI